MSDNIKRALENVSRSIGLLQETEVLLRSEEPSSIPDGYLSPNFRESEFTCNHCGDIGPGMAHELLAVLEDVRHYFNGSPVTINSGYRCKTHNTNVGSTESSQHRKGTAADIVVKNEAPSSVHSYLVSKYSDKYGIGRYDSFTHIDVREGGPARW